MSDYTPGPWEWLGIPGRSALNAAGGKVFDYAGYENLWPGAYDDDIDAANMCLIAAAPDLLEAALLAVSVLGHMAMVLGWTPEPGTVIPQLRAAIAKAEGR